MTGAAKKVRLLGFWMCTALVVGNMIGSGIFLLPASLAPFGWNSVLGWVLTITGGLALAYVFSQLSKVYPRAGGPYAFAQEAFGPAPAFFVAWSYWISIWVGNAAVATGTVSYLSVFFPSIAKVEGLHAAVTCASIWILTAVNCRGAFLAGSVQLVTTILKIMPLAVVVVLAFATVIADGGASLAPFDAGAIKLSSVTAAATLTLWGLLGLESATIPAEHVRDPEKTIPRATMIGVAVTGAIYLFACSAVVLLLPASEVAASNAPFADFVGKYMGGNAGLVLALFATISGFGALNGWILLQGELPFAMARGGVFPAWLGVASARGVPVRAHVASSGLLTIVLLMNYTKSMADLFEFVVLLSTTASLVMYLAVALAALKLQSARQMPVSPLLLGVAMIAGVYALWAIYGAGREAVGWGAVLIAAGAPVYLLVRWQHSRSGPRAGD